MTIITQKTVFYVGHTEHLPRHFCFESQGCFVFGNDVQHHANKGTQQIAEHRLPDDQTMTLNWSIVNHKTVLEIIYFKVP